MDGAVTVDVASEAIRLAQSDARRARRLATQALARAAVSGDVEAESMAERALGLAAVEQGRPQTAVAHLRRAVAAAERAGLTQRSGEARMSLSWALALRGSTGAALDEVERATAVLQGRDRARAQAQRALLLQKLGRLDEALETYRRAHTGLRRHDDRLWEARLLCNRGVLQVYRGALAAAEDDFTRSAAVHGALGNALAVTQVHHNLGWVAARRGDVPGALRWYDRVEAEYEAHGVPIGLLLLDRCEVLASARLGTEARAAAERAVGELGAERMEADAAEARLLVAQAALLDADPRAALGHAVAARKALARQGRSTWAMLASATEVRARWLCDERSAGLLRTARRAAEALAAAGWASAALDARLVAGRTALSLGRLELADELFAHTAAARRRGPLEHRVQAWHAEALRRAAHGDRRAAGAAVLAGLRALEAHRATLGASELRAHAGGHGDELARLGIGLALERRSARAVLAAAERGRAGALWAPPVRPPDDAVLAARLAELRTTAHEADQALLEDRDASAPLRRRAELEQAVRRHVRRAPGAGTDVRAAAPPSPADLAAALGDRALVELVCSDDRLYAVVVVGGRCSLRDLGPLAAATGPLAVLRFGLPRLAARHGTPRSLDALARSCATAASDVDRALLGPLHRLVAGRGLVVVPTGALHGVPWAALPSCLGRPVVVAASAGLWLRAERARGPGWNDPGAVALIGGPGLPAAAAEISALAAAYPGATVLTGTQATAEAAAAALRDARCAHLAMHGRFRADNPHLSSLVLDDGPLSVYDLEGLGRVPAQIVLSACESGRSDVRTGDELMGLAAALLALGTTTIVASLAPVPDADTGALMLAVHAGLRKGEDPATALAGAQARLAGDPIDLGRWAGFVCLGAG